MEKADNEMYALVDEEFLAKFSNQHLNYMKELYYSFYAGYCKRIKLSDDRFAKMSRRYEDEQKELAERIKKLRSEIEKQSSRSMTTDMFIGLVHKYTRARKLTPRMLNELIEKIEVFNAEKIDGVWEQRLRIHYNCVGTIEIPTVLPLPIPEVSINTRKGVVVNYAPCELAI